ncbi:hypothetical protein ONR75_10335 [Rhodopseudomonas sp. P2A-2r]|uniref:hypothetical protein n=1 Tax=Rhodopseudomonas sp. P2A-2r TaxID=2991972 RepID=UPI0022343687|nr:hypothetical protein [Rhodopseudomonas sp. P2A-2r]UZE50977.1 hypothetical protein ONR75_10335 [Rhodopseudomonas sp. P2A-2r]
MSTLLLENLKSATTNLAIARQSLEDAKFCARNRMDNNLAFATSVEHTAYHAWLRAGAALTDAQ